MQEYFKKPKLEKGKVFSIELYPDKEVIRAEYLGSVNDQHVFQAREKGSIKLFLADDHWVMELDGMVTYKPISSFSIRTITRRNFEELNNEEKSRLAKIFADVGAAPF